MKKYNKIMIALGMILVMVLCDVCLFGGVSVEAAGLNKNKTAFYTGVGYGFAKYMGGRRADSITKVSYKGNKVTITGALRKARSFETYLKKGGSRLKYGLRTYKMTKQCKYIYATGRGTQYVSKKIFFKKINSNYGCSFTAFNIYTNSRAGQSKVLKKKITSQTEVCYG